jgi:hypothetical protein
MYLHRRGKMRYIKVFCLESRFSENEILLDFDCIQVLKDRYVVMSDGEAQFSFPILQGYAIKPIKTSSCNYCQIMLLLLCININYGEGYG